MAKSYLELYLEYKDSLASLTTDDMYYDSMNDSITSGQNKYSLFNRYFDKKIDLRWVEEIEACIIPLDNIMRVPRKFIIQEEEIVPIERARKITNESIRHLAQHTNMIAKVEGDDVTPNQILNVFREESFEVYENRFVYTLMQNLIRFIDVRYNVIFNISDDDNMASLKMESDFNRGREKVSYKLEVSAQSGGGELEDTATGLDGENATAFQRIERIKKIINEYAHSAFMKELRNCVPVRPPIMRTNAIQKNPNFRACLKLWQFIQSYDELGYEITVKESNDMVSREYMNELNQMIAVNYMMLKANTQSEESVGKQKKRKLRPKLLKRLAEELIMDYDMEEIEIQRVFVDEMKRVSRKKIAGEEKIQKAIQRALDSENARKKEIEDKIKAKIALEKEKERQRLARERERARIAKEKEKARIKREKEREKARLAKEKELARIAKEKEKARLQKEKERAEKLKAAEEARIAKAKQREADRKAREKALALEKARKQKEREKVAKAKAKEKERLAKELAAKKAKAKADAEKQKQKEAIAKANAARAEKERIAKEAAKEKERLALEKAKAKEAAAKQKAKELARQKAEQEKIKAKAKADAEKAKAKEKAEADKIKAKAKVDAEKAKAKEKERLAREKAKAKEKEQIAKMRLAQAEKERIAKEKAKEKERIAREKAKEREKLLKEKAKAKEKERLAREKAKAKTKKTKSENTEE